MNAQKSSRDSINSLLKPIPSVHSDKETRKRVSLNSEEDALGVKLWSNEQDFQDQDEMVLDEMQYKLIVMERDSETLIQNTTGKRR